MHPASSVFDLDRFANFAEFFIHVKKNRTNDRLTSKKNKISSNRVARARFPRVNYAFGLEGFYRTRGSFRLRIILAVVTRRG